MEVHYRVKIAKESIGSAIQHKEPPLEGNVTVKVGDTQTRGAYKVIVLDCTAAQHAENLTLPGVQELNQDRAVKLAARFQPKRKMVKMKPHFKKGKDPDEDAEDINVPVLDLKKHLKKKPLKNK